MPDIVGSLRARAAAAACVALAIAAHPAAQQPMPSPVEPPAAPEFLSHYNVHLSAESLSSAGPAFKWNAHSGLDADIADYVAGRVNVLVDYQVVLGNELRPFDPTQGNYTLEASASGRVRRTEIAGVFHHVSRHLSDRPKRFAIAWNVLEVRALRRLEREGTTVDLQAAAGRVVQRASVDYAWTANGDVVVRRRIGGRFGVFGHGMGELIGVNDAFPSLRSDTQSGGRIEGGLRIDGTAAALEIFGGYERRIDADPIVSGSASWALAGFRLVAGR